MSEVITSNELEENEAGGFWGGESPEPFPESVDPWAGDSVNPEQSVSAVPASIEDYVRENYADGWKELPNPGEMDADKLVGGEWLVNGERNLSAEIRESGNAERQEMHDKTIEDLQKFGISESVRQQDGRVFATIFYAEGDAIHHLVFEKQAAASAAEPGRIDDGDGISDIDVYAFGAERTAVSTADAIQPSDSAKATTDASPEAAAGVTHLAETPAVVSADKPETLSPDPQAMEFQMPAEEQLKILEDSDGLDLDFPLEPVEVFESLRVVVDNQQIEEPRSVIEIAGDTEISADELDNASRAVSEPLSQAGGKAEIIANHSLESAGIFIADNLADSNESDEPAEMAAQTPAAVESRSVERGLDLETSERIIDDLDLPPVPAEAADDFRTVVNETESQAHLFIDARGYEIQPELDKEDEKKPDIFELTRTEEMRDVIMPYLEQRDRHLEISMSPDAANGVTTIEEPTIADIRDAVERYKEDIRNEQLYGGLTEEAFEAKKRAVEHEKEQEEEEQRLLLEQNRRIEQRRVFLEEEEEDETARTLRAMRAAAGEAITTDSHSSSENLNRQQDIFKNSEPQLEALKWTENHEDNEDNKDREILIIERDTGIKAVVLENIQESADEIERSAEPGRAQIAEEGAVLEVSASAAPGQEARADALNNNDSGITIVFDRGSGSSAPLAAGPERTAPVQSNLGLRPAGVLADDTGREDQGSNTPIEPSAFQIAA